MAFRSSWSVGELATLAAIVYLASTVVTMSSDGVVPNCVEEADGDVTLVGKCTRATFKLEVSDEEVEIKTMYNGPPVTDTMTTLTIGDCSIHGDVSKDSQDTKWELEGQPNAVLKFQIDGKATVDNLELRGVDDHKILPCSPFKKTDSGKRVATVTFEVAKSLPAFKMKFSNAKLYKGEPVKAADWSFESWRLWLTIALPVFAVLVVVVVLLVAWRRYKKKRNESSATTVVPEKVEKLDKAGKLKSADGQSKGGSKVSKAVDNNTQPNGANAVGTGQELEDDNWVWPNAPFIYTDELGGKLSRIWQRKGLVNDIGRMNDDTVRRFLTEYPIDNVATLAILTTSMQQNMDRWRLTHDVLEMEGFSYNLGLIIHTYRQDHPQQ